MCKKKNQCHMKKRLINGRPVFTRYVQVGSGFFSIDNMKKYLKKGAELALPHVSKLLTGVIDNNIKSEPIRNIVNSANDNVFKEIEKRMSALTAKTSGSGIKFFN